MHLEVKVALNFIVSYLYNKLPRRRADLFGEELERILMSRFEGHWYPEAPLKGSAFRCLHLGAQRDPVVELAAKRSGLDTEEVHANVPAELSVWIDPYEVSYQIGEKGAVKVLYLEDPPGLGCDGEGAESEGKGEAELDEAKSASFNPDAQVFVPFGSRSSPVHSSSPTPLSGPPCPALFSAPTDHAHSSNTSTPSPSSTGLSYLCTQQPPAALPAARPQPITFTTASFAATKFGSTKMKKSSMAGAVQGPAHRMLSHSPTNDSTPEPLSLSLHSLGGPLASQLSPNAKEFVYPGSPAPLYFDPDALPIQPHSAPFQHPNAVSTQTPFDPFSSPPPAQSVGIISGGDGGVGIPFIEKAPYVDGLASYNLQYPAQSFQPVVLAN